MFYAYLTRFEKVLTQFSKRHAYGVRKITEINLSSHLVACVWNRASLESARSTLCRPHLKQTITPVSSMMPSDSHCNQTLFRYRTLEDYRWHAVFVRRGRYFAPIRAAPYLDCITAKSRGFPLSVSVHDFAAWNYCTVRMAAQQRDLFSFLRKCEQQKTDSEIEKPDTESEKKTQSNRTKWQSARKT